MAKLDPEAPEVFAAMFSGGRSSAYMVRLLLADGHEPDEIIFTNTGMESPETIEFIRAVKGELFGDRLTMLEYHFREGKESYRLVEDVDDLRVRGEPFGELVEYGKHLPNAIARSCTKHLKIRTSFRYLYDKYGDGVRVNRAMGLRADEPRRVARVRLKNEAYEARLADGKRPLKWTDYCMLPLAERGMGREAVLAYWKTYPLGDLGFDYANPGVRLSNCVGCFFNGEKDLIAHASLYPEFADRWIWLESIIAGRKKTPNPIRDKFAMKYLGRKASEAEKLVWSPLPMACWSMIKEAAGNLKGKKFAFAQEEINWAGCGDGECGLDV